MGVSRRPAGGIRYLCNARYIDLLVLDEPCKVLLDLVSYSNAVCSEHSLDSEPAESVLVVFGLSKKRHLHYFEDRRGDGKPDFSGSGVPIRSDLRFMSGHLNPVTDSKELVCVLRSSDQVYHLSRDPRTGLWNEAPLVVQVVGKAPEAIKYAAFITTITLSNQQGFPVPQGYPVNLSSKDPTIALINNQTYRLGNKAEISLTDGSGYISIIIPVSNDAISCSELGVWM